MRLYLRYRIERDTDHNQERCPSKIKRYIKCLVKYVRQNADR